MKYCWKGTVFSADANKVGKELERLENDVVKLTNDEVLENAKSNVNSELHKCFEWDDSVASNKWRLTQATAVLTSIHLVIKENEKSKETLKVYYSLRTDSEVSGREYKNIMRIIEDDEDYKQLLKKAENEFISYKERYNKLLKLSDLKNIIYKNL